MDSFKVAKFQGGIADAYLTADANRSSVLDNWMLDENGHPYGRFGAFCFGTRIPTSASNTRISSIVLGSDPFGKPFFFRTDKVYRLNESDVPTEVQGPTGNAALPTKTNTDLESTIIWNRQIIYASSPSTVLPGRIVCTQLTVPAAYKALTLGLPYLASTPTVTSTGGTGSNYVYAFHYSYTFTDYTGTTFEEDGGVTQVALSNVGAPNVNTVNVTLIPTLSNTTSTNYDTTAITVRIYRTQNNGTVLYFVASVTNGTASYADTMSDTTLATKVTIYTNGGVLQNDQPPAGTKYFTQVNDFFWYASDRLITHSIQANPGASPGLYQNPMDQKIMGINSIIGFPILFCDRSVYRIEGNFDEFGNNGYDLKEISKTAGCVSNRSIVQVPGGLVWAGNGGFYFTDGYTVQKISLSLVDRYQLWRNSSITGAYDSLRNVVFWTVASSNSSIFSPNDSMACLHLNFGISNYSTFTTQGSPNNIFPVSLAFSESADVDVRWRSRLLIGETRGYFLWQDPTAYTDPKIDINVYPSQFTKKAILWRYESAGLDFGTDSVRKYCTHITAEFRNETDVALQFLSRRDDGGPWAPLSEMRQDGAILWEITDVKWNDPTDSIDHDWNSQMVVEGMRHLPSGTLRSTRRQLAVTNSKTWIARSDDYGTATTSVASGLKLVTLDNSAKSWPSDCEDYEVTLIDDSYTFGYVIKTRVSDTVVSVYDPYNQMPVGAAKLWQLRGYRKFERPYLLGFSVFFEGDGATQAPSRGNLGLINGT